MSSKPNRKHREMTDENRRIAETHDAGERDLVMTRVFDAPRTLVFDAHTRPELVRRWLLGPPGWSMPVCEIDLRVGGTFRYVWQHDRDGTKMGMGGVYREIKAPSGSSTPRSR